MPQYYQDVQPGSCTVEVISGPLPYKDGIGFESLNVDYYGKLSAENGDQIQLRLTWPETYDGNVYYWGLVDYEYNGIKNVDICIGTDKGLWVKPVE